MAKHIFVTGGVVSSLGKGITAASLGHLLKARGYAAEVREDKTREWERENLLENLLLAEDHAEALGDAGFKASIREARLIVEDGGLPDMEPLLARAREKILGPRSVDGVGEVLKETTPAPTKTEN